MGKANALAVAELHESALEAIGAGRGALGAPPRLERVPERNGGGYVSRSAADWDWFYGLSRAEQSRLRSNWLSRSADALSPDEIAEKMPLTAWLDHTRRADAARALACGRALAFDRYGGLDPSSVLVDVDESPAPRHGYCPHCGNAGDVEVVGLLEIADRLSVRRQTTDAWRIRGVLPDPDWTVGGRPAWRWDVIEAWALETGRMGHDNGEDF